MGQQWRTQGLEVHVGWVDNGAPRVCRYVQDGSIMAYPGFGGTCRMGQQWRTQGLEVHVGWVSNGVPRVWRYV